MLFISRKRLEKRLGCSLSKSDSILRANSFQKITFPFLPFFSEKSQYLPLMSEKYSIGQKAAAWSVHIFTSTGIVAGFMAILAIQEKDFRVAALWLVVALIIDGIDGTFARMANVKKVLPHMDGQTIDYVIDFATYAIIPAYFFHESNLVAEELRLPLSALILLVSAIYYGKTGMVTDDYYFLGFPVLWNMVVVCHFFLLDFSQTWNAVFIILYAILHFVPIKFVYPSRAPRWQGWTIGNTVLFIGSLAAAIWFYPEKNDWLTWAGYLSIGYYAGAAIYDTWVIEE